MDELDFLNEIQAVLPARRSMGAHVCCLRMPVAMGGAEAEFRSNLLDALRQDPDLTRLGRTRGGAGGDHAPFKGVAVYGPFSDAEGLFWKVRVEFGTGAIDACLVDEIVEDIAATECGMISVREA